MDKRIARVIHFVRQIRTAILAVLFLFFTDLALAQERKFELSFQITHKSTGDFLEDVQIAIQPCNCGRVTDKNGSLTLRLPADDYHVDISFIGYQTYTRKISLSNNRLIPIQLSEQNEQLSEVIVRAKKLNDNIESPQMGIVQLEAETLKKLPTFGGVRCI